MYAIIFFELPYLHAKLIDIDLPPNLAYHLHKILMVVVLMCLGCPSKGEVL